MNQRVLQIENYQEYINNNKHSISSLSEIVQKTFEDMRISLEDYRQKSIDQNNDLMNKMIMVEKTCYEMVPRINLSEKHSSQAEF